MRAYHFYIILILINNTGMVNAVELPRVSMPTIDTMQEMKVLWVAKNLFFNGYPMTIQEFNSPLVPLDVAEYYQNIWRVDGFGKRKYTMLGNKYSIGYEKNGFSYTVQTEDATYGSRGTLVVTKNKFYQIASISIPVLPGNTLVSRMHSVDSKVLSETTISKSSYDIGSLKKLYHEYLTGNGWVQQGDDVDHVANYQRKNHICQIIYAEKNSIVEMKLVITHCIRDSV